MSYDIAAGSSSQLTRSSGTLGRISMGWVRYLTYVANDGWLYISGNGSDWASGTGGAAFGVGTTLYGFTQNGNNGVILSGSDTAWVYVCLVETDNTGITVYFRKEGASTLTSVSPTDSGCVGAFQILLCTSFSPSSHKRITAYKEWTATASLTPAQILAESTQNAPIVTTANINWLSCDAGHTVGIDQSAAHQNWTVTGTTITIDADEPNMNIAAGGASFNTGPTVYI